MSVPKADKVMSVESKSDKEPAMSVGSKATGETAMSVETKAAKEEPAMSVE